MLKTLLLFVTLHFTIFTQGQNSLKSYVKENGFSISTIEPDSVNFDDLEIIGKSIGDARLVMLGEQDHGDAPTFLAKTRLIKYLHEKKGFNVLAFESDFFGLNFGFDMLEKNKPAIDSFIRKNIFGVWTLCDACQNLFYQYISSTYQTENPIVLTGFDNQMILDYSSKNLSYILDSLFHDLDLRIINQPNYESEILPAIDSLGNAYVRLPLSYDKFELYLNQIRYQMVDVLPENSFWIQVMNNLIAEFNEFKMNNIYRMAAFNFRDFQMALNLKWLLDVKFPDEKVIVWAANTHIAKYNYHSKKTSMRTMGSFLANDEDLIKDTYVLGFTSYKGTAGRIGTKAYSILKPLPKSFESWVNEFHQYSFVDFKGYQPENRRKPETFYMKALGHYYAPKAEWNYVFDGMFFIREMYPCKRYKIP